jgi:hypothetical protein
MWFTKSQIHKCKRADLCTGRTPLPSRMVSNGELLANGHGSPAHNSNVKTFESRPGYRFKWYGTLITITPSLKRSAPFSINEL